MSDTDPSDWQPGDPVHEPPTPDTELAAIETIHGVLAVLDPETQRRVRRWAYDRYVVHPAPAAAGAPQPPEAGS